MAQPTRLRRVTTEAAELLVADGKDGEKKRINPVNGYLRN